MFLPLFIPVYSNLMRSQILTGTTHNRNMRAMWNLKNVIVTSRLNKGCSLNSILAFLASNKPQLTIALLLWLNKANNDYRPIIL